MQKAAREHDIDLFGSFAVGDHPHDVDFAEHVGAKGIFVLSGHGEKHRHELPPATVVASGISDAAEMIINLHNKSLE
jgi:D-glycero-D-manno-heptose 1,7-bisphosphate phosphatase